MGQQGLILTSELNACMATLGGFQDIEYIEIAYGHTDALDRVCRAFGYGNYTATHGFDQCSTSAAMYPSSCNQHWLNPLACINGCGNPNYDGFYCDTGNGCPPGFEGPDCTVNSNDCDPPPPCQNGSVCVDGDRGFTCACPAGFTGSYCEINIDECAADPCVFGTCTDGLADYVCTCLPGFTGKNCDRAATP
jgi:hypothetical protein